MTDNVAAAVRAQLQTRWAGWPTHWRRAIVAALALLGMTALLQTVWRPAWRQLTEGPARQARLLSAVGAVQRDAAVLAELRRLPDAGAPALGPQALSAELYARSQRWLGTSTRVASVAEGWEVVFDHAPATAVAHWMRDVEQNLGLRLARAQWERDPTTGMWRGSAQLTLIGGQP